MFRKPFAVKKNTNLRNSDTRKLFNRLAEEVGTETEINKKSQVAQVKVANFNGDAIHLYLLDKIPLLFDFSETGNVYPTVFFMWQNPKAYPLILVPEQVLQYLENGADLMMPGIIRSSIYEFPNLRKGGPVAIALYDSSRNTVTGPVAVGCCMMSTEEMIKCGFQGKGVQVLHVLNDYLWEFGPRGHPPTWTMEEFNRVAEEVKEEEVEEKEEEEKKEVVEEKEEEEEEVVEPMESLLQRCFIASLKYRLKKSGTLPIDIGQFYTQYLLACVPDGRKLDMKKTKYKKFGTFLQEINTAETGEIVKVNKKQKGAETISEVNWSNDLFRQFELTNEKITDEAPPSSDKFDAPIIHEYFSITEPVVFILKKSKGELVTTKEIREIITKYVKDNNLAAGKSVKMDPYLADVTRIKSETSDWNTIVQTIQSRMTHTWLIKWADGREFVRKVHPPKVEFKIEKRSGNKKVTLINNLAVFGIDIKLISHQIQTGVATSVTSHPEAVCCEGPQVLVQGNQIHFISDLLITKYGIDKKFIIGMELAPKKK